MKFSLFCLAGLLLAGLNSFAQKPDKAIGQVRYRLTHIRDTTQRNQPYTETLVLLLGKNASAYKSLDKILQEERMKADLESQIKAAPDPNHLDLTIHGSAPTSNLEYFQYVNSHQLFVEEIVVNPYLAEEPLPVIAWKIKSDTLSFGALHCQKATAHFKGRDYEAWFCPDLPFKNGPWKLCGLPGLILEASDTKKEVVFKFDGFEDVSKTDQMVALPDDVIKTSRQDLDRLKEAQMKDPVGFSKATHGSGVAKKKSGLDLIDPSRIQSINVVAGPKFSRAINNPIEIPEKK